jgi:hypothetical protein
VAVVLAVSEAVGAGLILAALEAVRRWVRRVDKRLDRIERKIDLANGGPS